MNIPGIPAHLTPAKLTEPELWTTARDIVHFVGICGAGKSTLASRLAPRITRHGGRVIGTIDYDPHTPDSARAADRAFSRELDQRNIESDFSDPTVHLAILDHTLASLNRWKESDANVVLVDRWYESYDHLPSEHVERIESAIRESGFRMKHVLLLVDAGNAGTENDAITQRMLHTKAHRPPGWWATGPGSLDEWVREERACQDAYSQFVRRSTFGSLQINTLRMDWADYENLIVDSMIQNRWSEEFNTAWDAKSESAEQILDGLLDGRAGPA